jgi:hypothetical protein
MDRADDNENPPDELLPVDHCRTLEEALADLVTKRDRTSRHHADWQRLARMARQLEAEITRRRDKRGV